MTDAQGARRRQQQAVVWTEDFFFFLHSGFSCAALPLGASEGRLGIIIQYSRGPARLTHIRQVQSAPIDTWTCDFSFSVLVENRWGAADTLARAQLWQEAFFSFFFFFFLHIIRPRLRSLIAAPTPEQYIITPTAEGMSSLYHSSSPVRCVFGDFNIQGFRDFSSPTSLHFSASSPRAPPDWNNVCCFWLRQEVSSMLMTSPTALVTRRWHTGHFSHLCALGKRWQEWILWWIAPLRSVASGLEKIKSSKC